MKRNSRIFAVLVAALAFMVIVPSFGFADPAIVIKDDVCGMLDSDGNLTVLTEDSIKVGTFSNNCNATLSCKTKGVTNTTGKAVHWDFDSAGSLPCNTGFGVTEQWHEIISKSGVAHLICHVNMCP
ncbi:MAG: hypothetical protein ACREQF_02735 [Candidatus Binataceae bacterium]